MAIGNRSHRRAASSNRLRGYTLVAGALSQGLQGVRKARQAPGPARVAIGRSSHRGAARSNRLSQHVQLPGTRRDYPQGKRDGIF